MNRTKALKKLIEDAGKADHRVRREMLRRGLLKILEYARPSTGIWYLVKFPDKKWEIRSIRFDEEMNIWNHEEFWRKYVAPEMAREWKLLPDEEKFLKDMIYAFPRGRLENHGESSRGPWVMKWGMNFPTGVPCDKRYIESLFSLEPDHKTDWQYDRHERVSKDEMEQVKQMLGVDENWKTAEEEDEKLDRAEAERARVR